jgi:hypothetical protein
MSINETLANTFDIELSEQQVEDTSLRINEIKTGIAEQKYTLEDKEYIRAELQSLIEINRSVLETLSEQCKLGAPPRMYEVFATLSNTVSTNLMSLAKLDQTITDYQVKESDENLRKEAIAERKNALISKANNGNVPALTQINNTYNFTSNEMLNMLKSLDLKNEEVTAEEDLPKFDLR